MNTVFYLTGPTASGKTALSLALTRKMPETVFINADTMQLYKGLGVLSGLPSEKDLAKINHRLFGVLDVSEPCTPRQWFDRALSAVRKSFEDKQIPVLIGGSRSFLAFLAKSAYGMDLVPDQQNAVTYAAETEPVPAFPYPLATAMLMPLEAQIEENVANEVRKRGKPAFSLAKSLHASGADMNQPAFWTLGFRELRPVVEGQKSLPEALEGIRVKATAYAKEQAGLLDKLYQQLKQTSSGALVTQVRTPVLRQRVNQVKGFIQDTLRECTA